MTTGLRFKAGDKVKCIDSTCVSPYLSVNKEYVVLDAYFDSVGVEHINIGSSPDGWRAIRFVHVVPTDPYTEHRKMLRDLGVEVTYTALDNVRLYRPDNSKYIADEDLLCEDV